MRHKLQLDMHVCMLFVIVDCLKVLLHWLIWLTSF